MKVFNTHFTLRYRIRRKRIKWNFSLLINAKRCLSLSLIDRKNRFYSLPSNSVPQCKMGIKWYGATTAAVMH